MRPVVIDLDDGRQVAITSDPRSTKIWLQLSCDRSSKGIALTAKEAAEINCGLVAAIRDAKLVGRDPTAS